MTGIVFVDVVIDAVGVTSCIAAVAVVVFADIVNEVVAYAFDGVADVGVTNVVVDDVSDIVVSAADIDDVSIADIIADVADTVSYTHLTLPTKA